MNDLGVKGSDDELCRIARIICLLGQHLCYCCPILQHQTIDTQSFAEQVYTRSCSKFHRAKAAIAEDIWQADVTKQAVSTFACGCIQCLADRHTNAVDTSS